jgi:hypothetical protein
VRVHLASCLAKTRARPCVVLWGLFSLLLTLCAPLLTAGTPEQDAEAALMPFLDVLANPPSGKARAFRIRGRVESLGPLSFVPQGADASSLAPETLKNLPAFDFALQPPDRMRISVPLGDFSVTGCRNQQKLWATPGAQVQPLLQMLKGQTRPRPHERSVLQPIRIPFSGKQLAMLPILLEVQSRGQSALDQTPSRVLDVRVQPDIGKLLPQEIGSWALRLWLNAQGRPARLGVQAPGGRAVVRIENIDLSPGFPDSFWMQPEDGVGLTPAEFEDIARSISAAARSSK